jgi:uncharacterized protein (DUF1015 family)
VAHIIPFCGIRYDPMEVGDITSVVSPPYDRVYDNVRAACYSKSPYNIVRIIKGKPDPEDDETNNVYTRAAAFLQRWIAEGILVRDEQPGMYVYHQEYSFANHRLTRKGVIALGKLDPRKAHGHEQTLKGPKEDRLQLIRATEANFGHIFMLYNDPNRTADRALAGAVDGAPPTTRATDDDGNAHRVWRVTDSSVISTVQESVADKDLYIADGHHRYETALTFMRECNEKGWRPGAPESFDVRMMTLFNVAEPGMSIRPIHRLIHALPDFAADRFFSQAQEHFLVRRHSSFEEMTRATEEGRERHTVGCFSAGAFATLTLRAPEAADEWIPEDRSIDYRRLDVSILHRMVLEGLLGIDAHALEEQRNVTYTVDAHEGLRAVEEGREQILFYLNATTVDQVIRVADRGEKMPQKSTDFYPKLLTGLVFSMMEIEK